MFERSHSFSLLKCFKSVNPLLHDAQFERLWEKRPFENTLRDEQNAGNQHFLLFPQCFVSYQRLSKL